MNGRGEKWGARGRGIGGQNVIGSRGGVKSQTFPDWRVGYLLTWEEKEGKEIPLRGETFSTLSPSPGEREEESGCCKIGPRHFQGPGRNLWRYPVLLDTPISGLNWLKSECGRRMWAGKACLELEPVGAPRVLEVTKGMGSRTWASPFPSTTSKKGHSMVGVASTWNRALQPFDWAVVGVLVGQRCPNG